MVVIFGDVDKGLLQIFVNDHLQMYVETQTIFWRLTNMRIARDEYIDLEYEEYVPVGQILKFDLNCGGKR